MTDAPAVRSLQFIGTATTLLRLGPLTFLTDPNFLHRGQRAYLGYGLSSRRLTEPALTVGQLPELDAVLLSHMHGDHWDRVARQGLPRDVPVISTARAVRALHRQGFTAAVPLSTWESTTFARDGHSVTVTAMPGRHARRIARHLLPPVMGTMIEHRPPDGRGIRIYVTGDTLFVDDLRPIPARYPEVDVAVVHLGGTTLPGGMVVTMDAAAGADLLDLVRPDVAVPVHHDDYGVFRSPLSDFISEATFRGWGSSLRVAAPGEVLAL